MSLLLPAVAADCGRLTVTPAVVDRLEQCLDHLRHLDGTLGGDSLRTFVAEELKLATSLLDDARYTGTVGTRLHSAIAEGVRLCG